MTRLIVFLNGESWIFRNSKTARRPTLSTKITGMNSEKQKKTSLDLFFPVDHRTTLRDLLYSTRMGSVS